MDEELQAESGASAGDTIAPQSAEDTDVNQGSEGLTTASFVKASDKKGEASTPEDRVQKRINKLVGQRESLREENEDLRDKLEEMEQKVNQLSQPSAQAKRYTNDQLESAIKKAAEEGNWDVVSEAVNKLAANYVEEKMASVESANKQKAALTAENQQVLAAIAEDYPQMADPNSTLFKAAERIYHAYPQLKQQGNKGWYVAASRAYKILAEEGALGNDALRTRASKKEMQTNMGAGNVAADATVFAEPDYSDALDKFIKSKEKHDRALMDEISEKARGSMRR